MTRLWRASFSVGVAVALLLILAVFLHRGPTYSGSDAEVASVKSAVPHLLAADARIGRLPEDRSEHTQAILFSPKSVARRAAEVREVWAPNAVNEAIKDWEAGMTTVQVSEPGYADVRFTVTKWLGVKVHGDTAVADLRGQPVYEDWDTGWVDDQTLHHRVRLWRDSPTSDRWYLVKEDRDVDNEYQVMPQMSVGAAD
jgi:hypothetical protein